MASLKNWDNKTWLSSRKYIETFNDFITKNIKLTKNSKILDIGCGRGNIIGNLYSKLKLIKKPIGLDIENHKDRNKNIILKKIDAIKFITKTNITFDLILIKQTIHLLKKNQIIMLVNGGHGFKVLESVKMLEIKQGPFVGNKDKIKFDRIDEKRIKLKKI